MTGFHRLLKGSDFLFYSQCVLNLGAINHSTLTYKKELWEYCQSSNHSVS